MNATRLISSVAFGLAASLASLAPAWAATNVFDRSVSPCTVDNCSSERINGSYGSLGSRGDVLPWTIQVYAIPDRCLRLQITNQNEDLEAVLVAPDGTVYRNDDGDIGNCTLCPLIEVDNPPSRGWYTLQISHFAGEDVFSNFLLRYGLYSQGNPNCSAPTSPQFVRASRKPAGAAESEGPFAPGTPSSEE